ncbi:hypothetical protein CPB83DRAFT_216821 [Crepidotus variabilis]|uniref:Uncharacterized protein n=1 Tax=Crepidotus variabilis TaxID=179855 RepID=A0A9P6EUB9_9AGAR|nr:hypothetical protein CPB83DRAFT_216821 [Crepidotus variabilis]
MHPSEVNIPRRTPSPEIIEAKVVERPISWVEKDDDPEMEADVYHYIVPAGLSVVFQDEAGTKITRVGKVVQTLHGGRPLKSKPIIVHDTFGKELYRDEMPAPTTPKTIHGRIKGKSRETLQSSDPKPGEPHKASTLSSKTFLIDEKGNLIPIKSASLQRSDTRRKMHFPAPEISYHASVNHMQ